MTSLTPPLCTNPQTEPYPVYIQSSVEADMDPKLAASEFTFIVSKCIGIHDKGSSCDLKPAVIFKDFLTLPSNLLVQSKFALNSARLSFDSKDVKAIWLHIFDAQNRLYFERHYLLPQEKEPKTLKLCFKTQKTNLRMSTRKINRFLTPPPPPPKRAVRVRSNSTPSSQPIQLDPSNKTDDNSRGNSRSLASKSFTDFIATITNSLLTQLGVTSDPEIDTNSDSDENT